MRVFAKHVFLVGILLLWMLVGKSQGYQGGSSTNFNDPNVSYDSQGRPIKAAKKDSLQHRDPNADSITIYYRNYDSSRLKKLDTTINDISTRFPNLFTHINLGNYGTAARSLLFAPLQKAGWDAGFHQYDVYKFNLENTKFYQTTRPYTELAYLLGDRSEQFINATHTQNRKPNFNFAIEYRFSNMPGYYRTQNVSHNNIRFTAHYQGLKKRYESFFVFISNKQASSENGGVQDVGKLDSLALGNPFEIDTRLGSAATFTGNPFNTNVRTGNSYKESVLLYRHQYDFGQSDSLVKDSVTIHLFYPRFRLQHTLQISGNTYNYKDLDADSTMYKNYFNYHLDTAKAVVTFKDKWSGILNDFSFISFPEKNNLNQYAKVGIALQNLSATFGDTATTHTTFYNVFASGEYRNRTRNNVWDILAKGQLYLNGFNAGDYDAYISLQRQLSKKIGSLQIGFQNTNRTPSFIFDARTNFPVQAHNSFLKENIVRLFGVYQNPKQAFRLTGQYYLMSNYAYFDSFFTAKQTATLFNVLQVSAEKVFKVSKYWNWYTEVHVQQKTGNAPVNFPQVLTRNRLAFEGNFYTNLYVSAGVELRYYTNYNPSGYSPFTGQFYNQTGYTVSNRPDVNLFFDFRIKTFKGFVRLENINTITSTGSFDHYNFGVQNYPNQGLWFRLGIWWTFIN